MGSRCASKWITRIALAPQASGWPTKCVIGTDYTSKWRGMREVYPKFMGWERRGDYGPYYIRSKRVNGKVEKSYHGNGERAEIMSDFDRAMREIEDRSRIREASLSDCDLAVQDLHRQVDDVVDALLLLSGYHYHRGEWRMAKPRSRRR